jgi:hypothetical protein
MWISLGSLYGHFLKDRCMDLDLDLDLGVDLDLDQKSNKN